jgi:HlyD family secretion protein
MFIGEVYEIGHSAIVTATGTQDQVTKFQVKVRLLDKEVKLRPGMSCSVDIKTETKYNVMSIPLGAVTVRSQAMETDVNDGKWGIKKEEKEEDKKSKIEVVVFINKNDKAIMKNIETGLSDKGFIEIIKGLNEEDVVISGNYTAVSKTLTDSTKIKVNNKPVDNNKSSKR